MKEAGGVEVSFWRPWSLFRAFLATGLAVLEGGLRGRLQETGEDRDEGDDKEEGRKVPGFTGERIRMVLLSLEITKNEDADRLLLEGECRRIEEGLLLNTVIPTARPCPLAPFSPVFLALVDLFFVSLALVV